MGQIGKQIETVWVRPIPAEAPQRRVEEEPQPVRVRETEKEPVGV